MIPVDNVFDVKTHDMLQPSSEEISKINDEKAKDEKDHTKCGVDPSVVNTVFEPKYTEKLNAMLNLLPTDSSIRETLLLSLKKWIILDFCKQYGFKKVLLGSSAHRICTNLLA